MQRAKERSGRPALSLAADAHASSEVLAELQISRREDGSPEEGRIDGVLRICCREGALNRFIALVAFLSGGCCSLSQTLRIAFAVQDCVQ